VNVSGTLVERYCQGKPTVGSLGEQPVSVKVKRCRAATLSQSKFKKTQIFIDKLMCKILSDSSFNRNQAPKSADDWYIGVLKNKVRKLQMN